MSVRRYLFIMGITTFFCWVSWFVVLFFLDPEQSGWIGLLCFYTSLFFGVTGTVTIIGFLIRRWQDREKPPFRYLGISGRQGIMVALLLCSALFLQGKGLLVWWSLVLLVIGLVMLEVFFAARDSGKNFHKS